MKLANNLIQFKPAANRVWLFWRGGRGQLKLPQVDKNEKRTSLVGSSNPDQQRAYIESLMKNAAAMGGAGVERMREAGEQFLVVVRNSSGDIAKHVRAWAKACLPSEGISRESMMEFLIVIATRIRVLMKMSRIGVALKLLMTRSMGYADVLTDLLVAKIYYDMEDFRKAYATAGFAKFAIVVQAAITFFQYAKKSWKERLGRTFAALLGLGPLMEGWSVWTGKEDPDLLRAGSDIYAIMKGVEIAF
ncbi:hypothetical protein TrLO_g9357 [Triparma laevis f. longispina]|uniref:Uncharacterized protein n=1 Tax=Triparma laevis f. longispina TaxID=1714387 RepID=A0A9W7KZ89_9STRA|nr:hypothetical protein TrLO_g9357 [Triparma laevis f. longispina]